VMRPRSSKSRAGRRSVGNRQWRVRKRGFRDEGAEGEVRGLVVVEGEVVSLGEWGTEGSWKRMDAMKAR